MQSKRKACPSGSVASIPFLVCMSFFLVFCVCLVDSSTGFAAGGVVSAHRYNGTSDVRLPGGMEPTDVMRSVQQNRASVTEKPVPVASLDSTGQLSAPFPIGEQGQVSVPAQYSQWCPAVASDGVGYLVVWADSRDNGNEQDSDIYGARVSSSGELLDPFGIAISGGPAMEHWPAVAFDGTNYMVVWHDTRNGQQDIYGARVTVSGTVLDPDGLPLFTGPNHQDRPDLAFDGTNYLVVWREVGAGAVDIYGTRVTTSGAALDSDGIAICTATNDQYYPAVSFDGSNYLVVWEDARNSDTTDLAWDIYGARVSKSGDVLDPDGIAICTAPLSQWCPDIAFDGTNYLVVWADSREDGNEKHSDVYGTRLTPSGEVLDPDGVAISVASGMQHWPAVAFAGTYYLVAWQDTRNGMTDVYGARVSASGTLVDPDGVKICDAVNAQYFPVVAAAGDNYLVVWEDARNSKDSVTWDIYGARVDASANVLDSQGVLISTGLMGYMQYYPVVAFDGTNYLVVWEDARNSADALNWDVYGARVDASGTVLDPRGIAISTADYSQWCPTVAFDGTNYLVVWADSRESDEEQLSDVYGARVGQSGDVLDPDGIAISKGPAMQHWPAVAFDGTNYMVVWHDTRNGQQDIYGARVEPSGNVLDPDGIPIFTTPTHQDRPDIAFDGTNYLIVWRDVGPGGMDIYGTRVTTAGVALDPDGIPICTADFNQLWPAVAFDGIDYLVAWADLRATGRRDESDIYGARVSTSAEVLDPDGIAISRAPGEQNWPAVTWDGMNYVVVWEDTRSGSHDIYATRVDSYGTVLDTSGFAVCEFADAEIYPAVRGGRPGELLFAYTSTTGPDPELNSQRIWGSLFGDLFDPAPLGFRPGRMPARYMVRQSYPNPFNPACTIRFEVPRAGKVRLTIFSADGAVVRTLVDAWREPGVYEEKWDGRGEDGQNAPSGVYFYRLTAGDLSSTCKMVLLK
jgi:large repetitive protein